MSVYHCAVAGGSPPTIYGGGVLYGVSFGHVDVTIDGSGDAAVRWFNEDTGTSNVHHVSVRVTARWVG